MPFIFDKTHRITMKGAILRVGSLSKQALYAVPYTVNTWHKDSDGNWSYSKTDGKQATEEWVNMPGDVRYYFDADGNMAHDGWVDTLTDGAWTKYYFDHDGHYEVNTWHQDGNEKMYFKSDGTQANNEWVNTTTGRYYFDKNGHYAKNAWHEEDGNNLSYSKANGK